MHIRSFAFLVSILGGVAVACSSAHESSVVGGESSLEVDPSTASDGGSAVVDGGGASDDGSASDGGTASDDGSASDGGSVVTFADIEPILAATCSPCHHTEFATLDGVKTKRSAMISKISAGSMPKNDPNWHTTAPGIEILNYLQTSPELQ